jgi:hypothetical protein
MNLHHPPSSPRDLPAKKLPRKAANSLLLKQRAEPSRRDLSLRPLVRECTELRGIRGSFATFVDLFSLFNTQNGPSIVGAYLSRTFIKFKFTFESFMSGASQFFNTFQNSRAIRRFSPTLESASEMLETWATLVSRMNELHSAPTLPHVHQLQLDFEQIAREVSLISSTRIKRTYYKDTTYSNSNFVKHMIARTYQQIYNVLAYEQTDGFPPDQMAYLKSELHNFLSILDHNFIGLLPSSLSSTPEVARRIVALKSAGAEIVGLLEGSYSYRAQVRNILLQMSVLHLAICSVLDRLEVRYDIGVSPSLDAPEVVTVASQPDIEPPQPALKGMRIFVDGVGDSLQLDVTTGSNPAQKLNLVEKRMKNMIRRGRQSRIDFPVPKRAATPRLVLRSYIDKRKARAQSPKPSMLGVPLLAPPRTAEPVPTGVPPPPPSPVSSVHEPESLFKGLPNFTPEDVSPFNADSTGPEYVGDNLPEFAGDSTNPEGGSTGLPNPDMAEEEEEEEEAFPDGAAMAVSEAGLPSEANLEQGVGEQDDGS